MKISQLIKVFRVTIFCFGQLCRKGTDIRLWLDVRLFMHDVTEICVPTPVTYSPDLEVHMNGGIYPKLNTTGNTML